MIEIPQFLVIDQNVDGLNLLVRTVQRKFPQAIVLECQDTETALAIARTEKLGAIVTHRAVGTGGIELVKLLRESNADVPIVMVSSVDRDVAAQAVGASAFVLYDGWLTIGPVLEDLLKRPTRNRTEAVHSAGV